jgi:cytochrome c-type biogenesis protein CcmH/NrfG
LHGARETEATAGAGMTLAPALALTAACALVLLLVGLVLAEKMPPESADPLADRVPGPTKNTTRFGSRI